MDVPEAQLEETEHGLVVKGDGWFVVNARDVRWYRTGDARITNLGGDTRFEQVGVSIEMLGPGEPMACYHREWDQEGFLVLRGSGTLVVEGEERPLRQWDRTEYVGDPVAANYGAAPARTTTDSREAYDGWERPTHTRYDGWLD